MRLVIKAVLVTTLGFSVTANAATVYDEVDKASGVRTVAWATVPASPKRFSFNTSAFVAKDGVVSYRLELMTWSDSARYQDCKSVNWIADGRSVSDLHADYAPWSNGNAVFERFVMNADKKTIEQLASSKTIEYQVCNDKGVVNEQAMEGLRQVFSATR